MKKEINIIIGENIKRYLTATDRSQKELAEALGVTEGAVTQWCLGMTAPRIDTLQRIAEYFRCTLSDLAGDIRDNDYIIHSQLYNYLLTEADKLNDNGLRRLLDYINDLNDIYKK